VSRKTNLGDSSALAHGVAVRIFFVSSRSRTFVSISREKKEKKKKEK